jgi:hypothetical protein
MKTALHGINQPIYSCFENVPVDADSFEFEDSVAEQTAWGTAPDASGHKIEKVVAIDEELIPAEMNQHGLDAAERDQRLTARSSRRRSRIRESG